MAISNLSGSRLKLVVQDTVAAFPVWNYELVIDNIIVSVDIQRLTYHLCELTLPKKDRLKQITRYAHSFKQELERKTAHATLYNNFLRFKQYLIWCDQNGIFPFSEKTWRKYHGYLWELVLRGSNNAPIWTLSEGTEVGIKEVSANIFFSTTGQALTWCGENTFQWEKQLRQLRSGKCQSHEAYSENELPVILKRISSYFFQLAIPLLMDSPPEMISIEINNNIFDVSVKPINKKGRATNAELNVDTAFNQAMTCAYYLLSYFTAFNSSQLVDLYHPIEWKEDKTSEYYKLTAFKKRANKEVLSFVGGEIHKKSLKFIETLIALSLKYTDKTDGRLIYWLGKGGRQRALNSSQLTRFNIEDRLFLVSDKAFMCVPYLMAIHSHFIETSSKGYIEFSELKLINRTVTKRKKTVRRFYNRRVTTLSFALLAAIIANHPKSRLEDVNLKQILLPLRINREGHDLKIEYFYEHGSRGTFYIDAQYESFLVDIEKYAISRQHKQLSETNYLLPMGSERDVIQWQGLSPSMRYLIDYGVGAGQFFVNLTSSRFRETAAKLARRKANRNSLQVSQILNNQYRTVLKHYSEGNRYDNQQIISQGLAVIEKVAKGHTLEQSKIEVATELVIPVIKYDELIGGNININGVGVACFHKAQHSENHDDSSNSQVCFDYENCIKCQYAKLINDVEPLYRLISFLECMEESWLYYPERFSRNLGKVIELYRKIIIDSLSSKVIQQAQLKLDTDGRHLLWDNLELAALGFKGI